MRNNIEALTLLEAENSEVPNIGTVTVGWNTLELVEQKIKNAIEAHFDQTVIQLPKIDWESLESYQDTEIQVTLSDDGNNYHATILIQRTVIY
jgi:imidazoleglycerol phosphate synthase glutamine amidotransferase subunit HisH